MGWYGLDSSGTEHIPEMYSCENFWVPKKYILGHSSAAEGLAAAQEGLRYEQRVTEDPHQKARFGNGGNKRFGKCIEAKSRRATLLNIENYEDAS
jgi:hypothetical protein